MGRHCKPCPEAVAREREELRILHEETYQAPTVLIDPSPLEVLLKLRELRANPIPKADVRPIVPTFW
jgi:hypothetical protein